MVSLLSTIIQDGSCFALALLLADEMEKLMERLREEHQDLEEFLLPKDDIELGKEIGRGMHFSSFVFIQCCNR